MQIKAQFIHVLPANAKQILTSHCCFCSKCFAGVAVANYLLRIVKSKFVFSSKVVMHWECSWLSWRKTKGSIVAVFFNQSQKWHHFLGRQLLFVPLILPPCLYYPRCYLTIQVLKSVQGPSGKIFQGVFFLLLENKVLTMRFLCSPDVCWLCTLHICLQYF